MKSLVQELKRCNISLYLQCCTIIYRFLDDYLGLWTNDFVATHWLGFTGARQIIILLHTIQGQHTKDLLRVRDLQCYKFRQRTFSHFPRFNELSRDLWWAPIVVSLNQRQYTSVAYWSDNKNVVSKATKSLVACHALLRNVAHRLGYSLFAWLVWLLLSCPQSRAEWHWLVYNFQFYLKFL